MKPQFPDPPASRARQTELAGLLKAVACGDAQAFERFYDDTVGDAIGLAGRLVREPVEDILTTTYLRVWRDSAAFDPLQAGALDWLLGIVREQACGREGPAV